MKYITLRYKSFQNPYCLFQYWVYKSYLKHPQASPLTSPQKEKTPESVCYRGVQF